MAKEAFYFPHDYNAASDPKIVGLRIKFNNAEGYGIYFMILEAMAQEDDGTLKGAIDEIIAQLSLSYSLAIEQLKNVINFCIDKELFVLEENRLFSKRLLKHKEFREERKKSGKRGARSRWENGSAIGSAYAKERKGKEIKEKENTANAVSLNIDVEKLGKAVVFDSNPRRGL